MAHSSSGTRNRVIWLTGLGAALAIAVLVSPFASSDPDGLDRVAQDHGFDAKAVEKPAAHQLPFHSIFDEYALRGVPETIATPLAGLLGTLVTFGLAWGVGKLMVRGRSPQEALPETPEHGSYDSSDDAPLR
ncbi:MAG: PDGLE domain-containing protein [Cyanobacteria bacterium J069]|nr:MAG: cobalt transport protein [Cyanobacteria bacterium J069]